MIYVQAKQAEQPYLVSIGEEVEAIIQRLRERQISARMALEQIEGKAQEAVEAEAEQQRSHLPGKAFAFLWVLRGYGIPNAEAKAREVERILDTYPGWPYSQKIEQTVRVALYRALVDQVKGGTSQLTEAVNNLLKMHRTVMG
jgi:hypothetical protein